MSATVQLEAGALARMVGLAYEADLEPAGWQRFADQASETLEASLTLLLVLDHQQPERSIMTVGGAFGPEWLADFQELWQPGTPGEDEDFLWMSVRNAAAGTVLRNIDVLSRDEIRASRIFQRMAVPFQIEHALASVITNEPGVSAFLGLMRPGSCEPFSGEDKHLLRETVLAHLRRSVHLHRSLAASKERNTLLSAVTDAAPYGMLVYDRRGRLIVINQRAEQLLREPAGLEMWGQRLRCRDHAVQARLDAAMAMAMAGPDQVVPPPPVRVPVPGQRCLEIVFSALTSLTGNPHVPAGSACLVLIYETGATAPNQGGISSAVSYAYSFTPAEVRLCEALLRGLTLPEAADQLKISRNTAKTHLARIFDKTGVRSQIALLRLLAFGPPPHAADARSRGRQE